MIGGLRRRLWRGRDVSNVATTLLQNNFRMGGVVWDLNRSFDHALNQTPLTLKKRTNSLRTSDEENLWRKKAKFLEEQLSTVREELQKFRGALLLDHLPPLAPCKCFLFATELEQRNAVGNVVELACDSHVSQSSVQRFLKNVRILRQLKQRERASHEGSLFAEDKGCLPMVVNFVIDLTCRLEPIDLEGKYAEAYIHQAVEFIKDATIPLLRGIEAEQSAVEKDIERLVLDLVGKILSFKPEKDRNKGVKDYRVWNQVILMKLAELPFIGQRVLLCSTQQIALLLERLLCMDPFDDGVAQTYENSFFMFQLVDIIVKAHVSNWGKQNCLDQGLLEEWTRCHFRTSAAIRGQGTWGSTFVIFMDQITESMFKQFQCLADLNERGQDSWHTALLHLMASASSALVGI